MKYLILFLLILVGRCNRFDNFKDGEQTNKTVSVDGIDREYIQFLPGGWNKAPNMPILFVLHGGKGSPKRMIDYVDFRALANKEKFVLVYPKGIKKTGTMAGLQMLIC